MTAVALSNALHRLVDAVINYDEAKGEEIRRAEVVLRQAIGIVLELLGTRRDSG